MSISSLGFSSSSSVGEATYPPAAQQAKGAVAEASYQSRISDYGQIQNALSTLQSSVQNTQAGQSAALAAEAPGRVSAGYAPQESQLFQNGASVPTASSNIGKITHAVQSFVDAYNTAQTGSNQNPLSAALNSVSSATLSSIGITANQNGRLSLNTQTLQSSLISQLGNVAQVFAGVAEGIARTPMSAVVSQIRSSQNPPAPASAQATTGVHQNQASFASQPSNTPQNPVPVQKVESASASSAVPSSLAAQYSIVSQLG